MQTLTANGSNTVRRFAFPLKERTTVRRHFIGVNPMKYAIIQKVHERTGPTSTSFSSKVIDAGEVVEFSDTIETANETWGRIKNRARAYMAINIGEIVYCARLTPLPDPNIIEKLITWAKIQGFKP